MIQAAASSAPGMLLEDGLKTMRQFVATASRSGGPGEPSYTHGDDRNLVTMYLTTALARSSKEPLPRGLERELRTLAEAIDLIVDGQVARAGDMLMQRFRAVEFSHLEGWDAASRLEVIAPSSVSSVPSGMREAIAREHRAEKRTAMGKGPWRPPLDGPPGWPAQKGDGGKDRGKGDRNNNRLKGK